MTNQETIRAFRTALNNLCEEMENTDTELGRDLVMCIEEAKNWYEA